MHIDGTRFNRKLVLQVFLQRVEGAVSPENKVLCAIQCCNLDHIHLQAKQKKSHNTMITSWQQTVVIKTKSLIIPAHHNVITCMIADSFTNALLFGHKIISCLQAVLCCSFLAHAIHTWCWRLWSLMNRNAQTSRRSNNTWQFNRLNGSLPYLY